MGKILPTRGRNGAEKEKINIDLVTLIGFSDHFSK